ncbi:MAG: hypothetical protein O6945_05050 [Gammaproteobacteria bacterium]|nr:hypothetical protein [Gammaproteobacteria bacterium]
MKEIAGMKTSMTDQQLSMLEITCELVEQIVKIRLLAAGLDNVDLEGGHKQFTCELQAAAFSIENEELLCEEPIKYLQKYVQHIEECMNLMIESDLNGGTVEFNYDGNCSVRLVPDS